MNFKETQKSEIVKIDNHQVTGLFCKFRNNTPDEQLQTGMGDIEIFKNSGINVRFRTDKASRNIASSVSYVRGFFESASGERKISVSDKCTGIIEDFENYRYPEEVEGRTLSNDPIKDGFYEHGCDAFRYFITNRFPMVNNELIRIAR